MEMEEILPSLDVAVKWFHSTKFVTTVQQGFLDEFP
jgi:hypothetical protein